MSARFSDLDSPVTYSLEDFILRGVGRRPLGYANKLWMGTKVTMCNSHDFEVCGLPLSRVIGYWWVLLCNVISTIAYKIKQTLSFAFNPNEYSTFYYTLCRPITNMHVLEAEIAFAVGSL